LAVLAGVLSAVYKFAYPDPNIRTGSRAKALPTTIFIEIVDNIANSLPPA
jgi:hypothetical protein